MYQKKSFHFDEEHVTIYVPDISSIQQQYLAASLNPQEGSFPFWAKVWPSAIAMCRFLLMNTSVIAGKQVLEIAAGLGLPSILAARNAKKVTATDISTEAVICMQHSVDLNELNNVNCRQLNWFQIPEDLTADVVLMSDVNYATADIDGVKHMINKFLSKHAHVILATPERIVARDFISSIERHVSMRQVVLINDERIHVLLLVGQGDISV